MLGPLAGYAFLAGATLDAPDPDSAARRGPRGWVHKRSAWVAVGPWAGFLACAGLFRIISTFDLWNLFPSAGSADVAQPWHTFRLALRWIIIALLITALAYSWLVLAVAAVRRAKRFGRAWRSLRRGLAVAVTFLGSLFGGFWAITESFRGFFFDPTIAPVLLAGLSLGLLCGCASMTLGDVRRRDLFHAMLMAWTLGLALLWRWWSRSRPGSSPPRAPG
jgi:hypothetical protein